MPQSQIHVADILHILTGWTLIHSQLRTIDLDAAFRLTTVREFDFVRQCKSIHTTCVPPVARMGVGGAIPASLPPSRFKFRVNWRCTSDPSALLPWSTTVAKQALLPIAVAKHLWPKPSGCQAIRYAVFDLLPRSDLLYRASRHVI